MFILTMAGSKMEKEAAFRQINFEGEIDNLSW